MTAPLVDAHAHLGSAEELRAREGIFTILCGVDPADAEKVLRLRSESIEVCCALHPWHVEEFRVENMMPFLDAAPVIGEIGLDSAWTDADMDCQRRAFVRQLDIAREMGKPVVLHTKGMEEEIARTLERYDLTKLVHWYSCGEHLERYLDQDCYFTVGPDVAANPAVQAVARRAPLNRLLTETDGMDAVAWALNRPVAPGELPEVLRGELRAIAMLKGISEAQVREAVWQNLQRFLGSMNPAGERQS